MSRSGAPRGHLDRTKIVDCVFLLSRSDPERDISFRRIGQELDVAATALYRHFRDRDELMQAAVDQLYADALSRTDIGGSWDARLLSLSEELAQLAIELPSIAREAPLTDGRGLGELALIDVILEAFEEAGLSDEEAARAYAAFAGYVLTFAASLATEASRTEGAVGDDSPWIRVLDVKAAARFPRLVRHQEHLMSLTMLGVYRRGVAAIIDSARR